MKVAVAPEGRPEMERLIVWALPAVTAVLTVLVPEWACATVRWFGLALIEKSFVTGARTVRVTVVEWVAEVPVPVTVSGYVPGAAVPAFTVSVELPPEVMEVGLSPAVAPVGTPETERLTV